MVEDDVQLIQRILAGDGEAFTALVRKHQKSVHALVWRRVGDFHFAEEITQDTFLRVYEKLPTLKDPRNFSGWLYVITTRMCNTWLQRNKKSAIPSLEDLPVAELERSSYTRYLTETRETDARDHRHRLVKQLLKKLPESERTVVTLYYLGEMTVKEIGKFLGVSVNTITSRLQRARKRLQQDEELLVQEMLGSVQLSESLTENIARRVSDMEMAPPSTAKPFLPWVACGAAAVLVTLMLLGLANQYLVRFQNPYSFEAQSEPRIEIIDAPIVLNTDAKPAVRSQAGRADTANESSNAGVRASELDSTANASTDSLNLATSPWTQATAGGTGGDLALDIFATSEGVLYAFSQVGVHRLTPDAPAWMLVNSSVPTGDSRTLAAEYRDALYIVSNDTVFASTDNGETWNTFCTRPMGDVIGFVITDGAQQADIAMYLAVQGKGVFRSIDAGKQWTLLADGLMDRTITAMATVRDTVFAGTDRGLYRLASDVWERLPVDTSRAVQALAVSGNNLYVGTGSNILTSKQSESEIENSGGVVRVGSLSPSKVFRSTDLGASWINITPTYGSRSLRTPVGIRLLAAGETLLALGFNKFRSKDGGQTWTDIGFDGGFLTLSSFSVVAANENTFYNVGSFGIHRTTDGGKSWKPFMDGIVGTGILDMIVLNDELYAHTDNSIARSADGGESWQPIPMDSSTGENKFSPGNFDFNSKLMVAGNVLYGITAAEKDDLCIFYLSTDSKKLVPIQGIPNVPSVNNEVEQTFIDHTEVGAFAVSGKTFYAEYQRHLFKWQQGDSEWTDTGLVDTGEQPDADLKDGFKLAVSGKTVYVGKRSGGLFQSLDGGDSWKDITPTLPLFFTCFNEIIFAGSTVYVATDRGVLASQTGAHWRVITDDTAIDTFAVDGLTVYGAGDEGVYRLDTYGRWKQISPRTPGKALSLVVDRNRLYVATEERGMFHISLEDDKYVVNN